MMMMMAEDKFDPTTQEIEAFMQTVALTIDKLFSLRGWPNRPVLIAVVVSQTRVERCDNYESDSLIHNVIIESLDGKMSVETGGRFNTEDIES